MSLVTEAVDETGENSVAQTAALDFSKLDSAAVAFLVNQLLSPDVCEKRHIYFFPLHRFFFLSG